MNEDRVFNGMDDDLENTQYFSISTEQESGVKKVLSVVYEALSTKGYDPVNQIVGYIMSGDPTYITNYMGARSLIMKVERDELVEEILQKYISSNGWHKAGTVPHAADGIGLRRPDGRRRHNGSGLPDGSPAGSDPP